MIAIRTLQQPTNKLRSIFTKLLRSPQFSRSLGLSDQLPSAPISYRAVWSATDLSDQLRSCPISYRAVRSATELSDQLPSCQISYRAVRSATDLSDQLRSCPISYRALRSATEQSDQRRSAPIGHRPAISPRRSSFFFCASSASFWAAVFFLCAASASVLAASRFSFRDMSCMLSRASVCATFSVSPFFSCASFAWFGWRQFEVESVTRSFKAKLRTSRAYYHVTLWCYTPGPSYPKPDEPNCGLGRNILASLFAEYETDSLPKRLDCKVGNQMNSPVFSLFKHMQFAGSWIGMKNFTNPRLA